MKLYRGIVVDNKDPLKLGRVRVQIHNVTRGSDFETLYWANVIQSPTFGLLNGIGFSNVLRKGTNVYLIFEEDNHCFPVVIGTIVGQSETYEDVNFRDPDAVYPKKDLQKVSDYATESVPKDSTDLKSDFIDGECGAKSWVENTDQGYYHQQIFRTESGHQILFDNREGNHRIELRHASGNAVIRIDPQGNISILNDAQCGIAIKSSGDIIIESKQNVRIKADENIVMESKDFTNHVEHDEKHFVGNDSVEEVSGNTLKAYGGDYCSDTNGNTQINTAGDTNLTSNGKFTAGSTGAKTTVSSSGNIYLNTPSNISLNPGGRMSIDSNLDVSGEFIANGRINSPNSIRSPNIKESSTPNAQMLGDS